MTRVFCSDRGGWPQSALGVSEAGAAVPRAAPVRRAPLRRVAASLPQLADAQRRDDAAVGREPGRGGQYRPRHLQLPCCVVVVTKHAKRFMINRQRY